MNDNGCCAKVHVLVQQDLNGAENRSFYKEAGNHSFDCEPSPALVQVKKY